MQDARRARARSRAFTGALLFASILGAPVRALAQNADNKVQAEALFEEGRHLMEAKNFAAACPKLEASQKLDPGAGTLLNLAACYEGNGQLASAWVTYKDAAAAAQGRHPDWADQANAKADELKPKLSHLTVVVSQSIPGLEVKRDGNVIAEGVLGAAMPVDSGTHTIDAAAPGRVPFSTKVVIPASQGAATVTIPALAMAAGPAEPQAQASTTGNTQRLVGVVVTGVGVVGIGVGAVFGVLALGKKSSAGDHCSPDYTVCGSQDGIDDVNAAKSDGFVSTVTIIGGAAFATAGIVLYLTAPHAEKQPDSAGAIQARLGAPGAPAGFSFGGSF